MSKFNNCLKQGNFYEEELKKYVSCDTFETSKSLKNFKDWDVKTTKNDKVLLFEVKSETNASKTGNICIEFSNSNMPSGINATKADYWVHYVIHDKDNNVYDIYIIPTNELKTIIKNKQYFRAMRGGDGGRAEFYLVKISTIQKYKIDKTNSMIREILEIMDKD
jgi:hypothetical protein